MKGFTKSSEFPHTDDSEVKSQSDMFLLSFNETILNYPVTTDSSNQSDTSTSSTLYYPGFILSFLIAIPLVVVIKRKKS